MKSGNFCSYVQIVVLPFFCGPGPECRGIDNRAHALAQAKLHISRHYIAVGTTEHMSAFMQTLEVLLPRYFTNITALFHKRDKETRESYRTVKRPTIRDDTRQILRNNMAKEYELYEFVKQRFYNQYQKVIRMLKS